MKISELILGLVSVLSKHGDVGVFIDMVTPIPNAQEAGTVEAECLMTVSGEHRTWFATISRDLKQDQRLQRESAEFAASHGLGTAAREGNGGAEHGRAQQRESSASEASGASSQECRRDEQTKNAGAIK